MSDESPFFRSSPCLGGCRRWIAFNFKIVVAFVVAACGIPVAQSGPDSLNKLDSSKPLPVPIGFDGEYNGWIKQVDTLSDAIEKALRTESAYSKDDVVALKQLKTELPAIRQAIAKVKVDKDGGKIIEIEPVWVEKLRIEAEKQIKKPQQIVTDAEKHREAVEVEMIERNVSKVNSELETVNKLLGAFSGKALHPSATEDVQAAENMSVGVRGAIEEYTQAKGKPPFSEQRGLWLPASQKWLETVSKASEAVKSAKTKHEADIKREIDELAIVTITSLGEANTAKAAIPKDDRDALNEIENILKLVQPALSAYNSATESKKVVVEADTLQAMLTTANTNAKSAKTLAETKRTKHETDSKTEIQSARTRNSEALKTARKSIDLLISGNREWSKEAVGKVTLAERDYAEAAGLLEEFDGIFQNNNRLKNKSDLLKKLEQVESSIKQVNQRAEKIDEICKARESGLRFWRWTGGAFALCLFGTGSYFFCRGWRRHGHMKRANLLLGGFTEQQGTIRIETGAKGGIRSLKAPDAFKKRLGYTSEGLAKMTLADLFAPTSRPELEAALVGMAADGKTVRPKRIQCQLQTKEGGTVQVAGVLLVQRSGGPGSMVALLEDVSWRNDLADAQARIAALSFHGNEGLLLLDEEQRIVVVNPVFCQWFGLTKSAGELRGLPVDQLGPNFTSLLKDSTVITGAESASKSIQVGDVNLHAEATPVTAGSRQAGRAIFFRDVTAEVQANEKLRPLMERFRDSTPENFHIGMAVIAPDGSVLAASQSMCNFFGYSREELLAQNEQKLRTSGNGAEAAKGSVSQAAVRRSYRRKDGSVVTARVQMTECRDERGALLYSTMSIDDRGANPAPPKPAVWMSKDATEAWCPAVIAPHLPWVSAGFKYEDNYADQADAGVPGWHLSGATRRGRLHAQHGTHREDAFCWETGETFTIACVSDGAGAYKYSRIGSESICRDVTRLIRKALDESKAKLAGSDLTELTNIVGRAMQESVRQASTSLHELAVKAPCEIKDFRCTMLLVVQYQHASGAVFLGSQVGDGFIQGLMQDGTTQRFGTPDSGKFSGEVSCFLPEVNAVEKAYKIFRIPHEKLQTLLLCTDGIEDAFFPIEKAAEGLFRQLNNGVQQKLDEFDAQKVHGPILGTLTDLVALQAWLDFEKRGENDDRTVLVLHRQQSVSTPPVIAPG